MPRRMCIRPRGGSCGIGCVIAVQGQSPYGPAESHRVDGPWGRNRPSADFDTRPVRNRDRIAFRNDPSHGPVATPAKANGLAAGVAALNELVALAQDKHHFVANSGLI